MRDFINIAYFTRRRGTFFKGCDCEVLCKLSWFVRYLNLDGYLKFYPPLQDFLQDHIKTSKWEI